MKGLKFSFAAIIAVVAVGLTIAAQAGAFDTKALASDCYQPNFTLKQANCQLDQRAITAGTDCINVAVGDHVFAITGTLIDPVLSCSGSADICCVKLVVDNQPCTDQQRVDPPGTLHGLNFYKVSQVVCKD